MTEDPNLLAIHDEFRVVWENGIVDGPFTSAREAEKFAEKFATPRSVQVRTIRTVATEWKVLP